MLDEVLVRGGTFAVDIDIAGHIVGHIALDVGIVQNLCLETPAPNTRFGSEQYKDFLAGSPGTFDCTGDSWRMLVGGNGTDLLCRR